MSNTLPNSVLSSPTRNESEDDSNLLNVKTRAKFYEIITTSSKQSQKELHQNRIQALRKELDSFKESEWKYQPIDKYIGQ